MQKITNTDKKGAKIDNLVNELINELSVKQSKKLIKLIDMLNVV